MYEINVSQPVMPSINKCRNISQISQLSQTLKMDKFVSRVIHSIVNGFINVSDLLRFAMTRLRL